MKEVKYMISDTAKKVDVEAHVLRYWEEELELPIARNEMGHRYYTPDDIVVFKNIKELKEQGFQLKAIKMLLPELQKKEEGIDNLLLLKDELNYRVSAMLSSGVDEALTKEGIEIVEERCKPPLHSDKIQQFEEILSGVVKKALQENNMDFGKEMGSQVSNQVIKEMDYLGRMKEEREEERYKKLDETIRILQKSRQEAAAAGQEEKKDKSKLFFRRKRIKTENQHL